MNKTTRILWSGLTGKTGRAAMKQVANVGGVEIVAGLKRNLSGADDFHLYGETFTNVIWYDYGAGLFGPDGLVQLVKQAEIDAIVGFAHPDVFEEVVELAVRTDVPLISGTSGLSDRQLAMLHSATNQIPVFRGGNFRFKVKQFIDEAVKFARNNNDLVLVEQHWQGQPLPSEAAKKLVRAVGEETSKKVDIVFGKTYAHNSLINEWLLNGDNDPEISCRTVGFDELAHDVLEIAKVMATKSIHPQGKFYDLDLIWSDLPHA